MRTALMQFVTILFKLSARSAANSAQRAFPLIYGATMQDTAVVHAGTSHSAWELAILQLIESGMERDAAEAWLLARHWQLTRVPDALYEVLTRNVLTYGLWGHVQLACANWHDGSSLVMLLFKPSRHWVHLLSPTGLKARNISEFPYHISICYVHDLWKSWQQKRHQLYLLDKKYSSEVAVNLPIKSFGSGASALIDPGCELHRDLFPLWHTGSESYKTGLHVSF